MTVSHQMIRSYVDRILRLKEEQDTLGDDVKEVYAEARSNGFDKTALGKVVSHLRRHSKDAEKATELDAVFDTYLDAYNGGPSHTHAHAREEAPRAEAQKPAERPTVTLTAKDGAGNTLATAGPVSIDTFIAATKAPKPPEVEPEIPEYLRRPKPAAATVPA